MGNENARIPTLDIRDFTSGNPQRKADFVERLGRAYEDTGFVVIKGHRITHDLQKTAYEKIDAFYKLPLATKRSYEVPGIGGARGYTTFGKEHAKDTPIGDLKEFFHVGIEVPEGNPLRKEYPANVSVKEVPGFDSTLRHLYDELLGLGTYMLRAIAIILEQDERYFDEKVKYGNSILRPIHYPALTGKEDPSAVRSAAHEDINLITLLIGASSPGLQVKTKQGEWLPVTTEADEIVVNVGDMLQRLSNHKFKSTTHRVTNPPPSNKEQVRYSIPFFLHPVSNMSLAALPSCITPHRPVLEAPITAGEYLAQRLREIGLY
ncbi:MAG: isopenicillin N synthase family oxygenase [Bdellovibrionales bacterium]|nr:isopenicillin N synthase family oxygenase [Bdellovibrionales bacterium]